jgi:hypothetical protein
MTPLPGPTAPFGRVPTAAWPVENHLFRRGGGQRITRFTEYCGEGLANILQRMALHLDRCVTHAAGLFGGLAANEADGAKGEQAGNEGMLHSCIHIEWQWDCPGYLFGGEAPTIGISDAMLRSTKIAIWFSIWRNCAARTGDTASLIC